MTDKIHTLRPGLLVSLKTGIRGNVSYQKVELENAHRTDGGEERARWETTRVVVDPDEHVRATKLRSRVRCLITAVCSQSAFGLLCPEDKFDDLKQAIAEARELVDDFNSASGMTHMSVNVLYGEVGQDDVEAVRSITGEIRALMEDMERGITKMDAKAVRAACNQAREVGDMLTPEAKSRLDVAISAARSAARQIVKAGEEAAVEVDKNILEQIDSARVAFLDMEFDGAVAAPQMSGRAIDLEV